MSTQHKNRLSVSRKRDTKDSVPTRRKILLYGDPHYFQTLFSIFEKLKRHNGIF